MIHSPRVLDDLGRDLRYALRVLGRSPLFSLVAIGSLAIGIGGAASVFTVLNAVALRNLPVPNPQQLVAPEKAGPVERNPRFSWPEIEDARTELAGRAELAAFTYPRIMNVRAADAQGSGAAERQVVQLVSGEFFTVLRQRPQAGRLLAPSDNVTVGAHPVAVISDAYWERQYQRAPDVIGRTIAVNGAAFTIVGVAAPRFFGGVVAPRNPDLWLPLMMQAAVRYASNASSRDGDDRLPWPPQRGIQWLRLIARVPDEADRAFAAGTMTALHRRALRDSSSEGSDDALLRIEAHQIVLEPAAGGLSELRKESTPPLLVLLAMVGILLAIACGNLASLLVSRAAARDREMAIRLSIGAGRSRLVRQLLAETLVLAAAGGGLGLLVAAWGRDLLIAMFSRGGPTVDLDTGFDGRVLAFAVGVTVSSGLAAGILPALRSTRVAPAESLKAQGRSETAGSGPRGQWIGKSLVAGQLAFCLLLLVLAALFARSLHSLLNVDVGYDRDRILVASIDVRSMGLPDAERQALYARLVERLSAVPGVASASLSLNGPLGTSSRISSLGVEGYTPAEGERLRTNEEIVTGDYFETVGLRIVEGRGFSAEDRTPRARASLINESMARRFFPPGGAVGKRWNYGGPLGPDAAVIVGVVQDAAYVSVRGVPPNMTYRLAAAAPDEVLGNLELRASVPPAQMIGTIRKVVAETEPALPAFDIAPLDTRLNRGLANDRLVARLTAAFGGIALLLACLGLYGTISYGVTRRGAELGVRIALGAARRDVLWLVLREAALLVLAGATIGLPLAYLAGRSLGSLLYGVQPLDAPAYLAAAGLLAIVAGVAAFLPAHRASRIDPMAVLRNS